jgi:hypothetical protein
LLIAHDANRRRLFSFSASSAEIPVEVDHALANLVLPAYRLPERGETLGSTLPANRSQ